MRTNDSPRRRKPRKSSEGGGEKGKELEGGGVFVEEHIATDCLFLEELFSWMTCLMNILKKSVH